MAYNGIPGANLSSLYLIPNHICFTEIFSRENSLRHVVLPRDWKMFHEPLKNINITVVFVISLFNSRRGNIAMFSDFFGVTFSLMFDNSKPTNLELRPTRKDRIND